MQNDVRGAPILSEHMPVQMRERGAGRVVCETEYGAMHLNAIGTVHGGMLASLLDMVVTGAAASAVNDGVNTFGVTISFTINFVRALGPGLVRCEGVVTGGGARTKFVDARIYDATGELVTTATATVRVVERTRKGTVP